ncbi:MAG: helix-turn-helix domain-containing protein [Nanoarchaeota archaeon]
MIVQKEFLIRIKDDFRLNIYEVKIWTALLSRGIASAGELADISGVPRSRCYDVLESLEKKGFIITKIGKPIKYIAVQPEEIVSRVKKKVREDSESSIALFERLRDTELFKELAALHKAGIEHIDATEISGSIVGKGAINRAVKKMVTQAKSKVIIASSENSHKKDIDQLKNALYLLNKKNVSVKVMAPINEKTAKKYGIKEFSSIELNSRFIVADDELIFRITDESASADYETAVWVKSNFFTKSLSALLKRL